MCVAYSEKNPTFFHKIRVSGHIPPGQIPPGQIPIPPDIYPSDNYPPCEIPPGHIPTTLKKVMIDLIFKFER